MRLLVLFLLTFFFFSCKEQKTKPTDIREAETSILLHSPMGIRAEFNIDKKELELWLSPQSGKTIDIFYRNFSNRDDHTSIFDKVSFPKLNISDFDSCQYDPFHSIVYYKNQVMHIATLWDKPSIILWFEKPEQVDFKTDKADKIIERDSSTFICHHPDRGLDLCFVAAMGKGKGTFQHQLVIDKGRSTYARAHLSENQPLFIAAELTKENVPQLVSSLVEQGEEKLLAETNLKVNDATKEGRVMIKDNPKLQRLLDVNRRVWVSIQDHSGALKSSVKSIYYLIWVREGGLAAPLMAGSGWVKPLELFNEFNINTPTIIDDKQFPGIMYGQLCNPKINKWEEDGTFYTIWSAFTHWTQTGDDRFIKGKYLSLMEQSMDWLERYSFDKKKGLFFRYYYCETPLKGSRDYGWDNAVGNPESRWEPAPYKGKTISKSYDVYINLLNYNCYMMLAMMNKGDKAASYMQKAKAMEPHIMRYFRKNELPYYGELVSEEGDTILADPYGMDETDYQWALTLCPFYPNQNTIYKDQERLFDDLLKDRHHYFLAAYFSILNALDIDRVSQDSMMSAINHAAELSYKSWKYLPLPYAMGEMSYEAKPGSGHYIRPQMFTIGAWLGAMGNMGVKRLPFGIAVRNAKYLDGIENYMYLGSPVNIMFKSEGNISSIILNGKAIEHSFQIPDDLIIHGTNELIIERSHEDMLHPMLIASTVRLKNIRKENNKIFYSGFCYGKNQLSFKGVSTKSIRIIDEKNTETVYDSEMTEDILNISFEGYGNFLIEVNNLQ